MKDKSKKSTYSTTFGVDPEDFDFFYPIAKEHGALQKFYENDWHMLIGNSYKNIPICATYFVALFT